MDMQYVLTEVSKRIGIITINRPDKRNALNDVVVKELLEAFYQFENSGKTPGQSHEKARSPQCRRVDGICCKEGPDLTRPACRPTRFVKGASPELRRDNFFFLYGVNFFCKQPVCKETYCLL